MTKILVLNFFPAFTPPASGGELRYFNIYEKLSKYFDITLLSPTYNDAKQKVIKHTDTFREYRVPKEDIHNEIHWKLEQENFSPEFSGLTCAYAGEKLNEYHKKYLELYKDADIIIHDFPYMLNYDLFFGIDNKPRIYNSHNLEYDLLKQIYKGHNASKHLEYIYRLEERLTRESEVVFATSKLEADKFSNLYKVDRNKIKLAPNGINPEDFPKRDEKIMTKTAFFIGNGHPPNIEAVNFIIENLADKCPDITFLIAGTCCSGIDTKKKNIKLLGKVDDSEKNRLFKTVDIAINPIFSGAGTSLKSLEYLSMGIPMISTDVGVRGLDLEDQKHFILADRNSFAEKLNKLVNNDMVKNEISKNSKIYINEKFNWSTIAENVQKEILKINKKNKKTLLLLNDFEVSKPFSGGEIRINKLYSELSKTYNVLLLCLNNKNNIQKTWITDSFLEISFPKTKKHIKEENKINSQYWVSATDIVTSYMISKNDLFMKAVKAVISDFNITVLTHPYMYESIKNLKYNYLIYESHNYELLLKKELLKDHPNKNKLIRQTENVERKCCLDSNLIISVSDTDHEGLMSYDAKKSLDIVTIKNGVEINNDKLFAEPFSNVKNIFSGHTIITFIGSAHIPNIESVKFILQNLAIEKSDCYFIIIGNVCDAIIGEKIPPNVLLFGKLEDEYKNVLLSITDIAINPVIGGSGSNLKLAEYFAWKIPTITTTFGARGYEIENEREAIICNREDFSKNITKLQNNKKLAENIAFHAFEYVQSNIEWSVLGKQYRDLLDNKVFGIKRKKLLIVTYRFTNPPLGGAEVYLYELIKELDKIGDFDITVAYLDSYDIKNQYHFSIKATRNTKTLNHNFKNVTFKKFRYNELDDKEKLYNSKILMKNWINEFLISARKFINYYDKTILLGGWNFPEKTNESFQVWSSSKSEIYLKNINNIILKGYSPSKKLLTLKINNKSYYDQVVSGNFKININIEEDGVLSLECKEEYIGDDIRPLGVMINSVLCNGKELNLGYCYRDFLKEKQLDKYIDELIFTALQRNEKYNEIFQITRGLNSDDLEEYLDKNTKKFDILLGHSVPFETSVLVSKYALKYNKQYTILPHFHFDDEFYHWKSYYTAMQKANCVFASPSNSIKLFYDKLNIKTIEVPGGGINKSEYLNINSEDFLNIYKSDKPYFLVLGRKSGAKNYAYIIKAIEKVNEKEHICNLVMIGRDEDGIEVNSKYTYYLGEQPRKVVLGSLKECYGLITMSESESFGIVIIEAWMLSKPVIINGKCPAFVELVKDQVNGLYADKDNLANKIKYLLNNPEKAILFGENGNREIDKYTWEDIGQRFNHILLNLN